MLQCILAFFTSIQFQRNRRLGAEEVAKADEVMRWVAFVCWIVAIFLCVPAKSTAGRAVIGLVYYVMMLCVWVWVAYLGGMCCCGAGTVVGPRDVCTSQATVVPK